MATIEIQTDESRDLTVVKVIGSLVAGQLREALDKYYAGPSSRYCIIDLIHGSWSSIPVEKFNQSIEHISKYDREDGKTALVFGNDADFGIGRMLESNLSLGNFKKQVECFRSLEKALEWVLRN